MKANKNIFFKQLDHFIFKYHLIKFLQSLFIGLSLFILITLLIILFNYYTYPSVKTKRIIFAFYILISSGTLLEFVLIKILPILSKKRRISYKQAATLIIQLDPEFDDRLLSIIDLSTKNNQQPLIQASINQKISSLKLLDFKNILTLKQIARSIRYVAVTIIFLLLIAFFNTDLLRTGTMKFVNYNKFYPKPAPFKFILLNSKLETTQDSDFTVRLKISGEQIPQNVFIVIKGQSYLMPRSPKTNNTFYYTIKNPSQPIEFYFTASGFSSTHYKLKIKYLPLITSSKFVEIPPEYTGIKPQTFYNVTNLVVPQGSKVIIKLRTRYTSKIVFSRDSMVIDTIQPKKTSSFSTIIRKDQNLKIRLIGISKLTNTLSIKIKTIPDLSPLIKLAQATDSTNLNIKYFNIYINDDYGFSSLHFVLEQNGKKISYNIPLSRDKEQNLAFAYSFDSIMRDLRNINYYFVVCDNKTPEHNCTKSEKYSFTKPDPSELTSQLDSLDQTIEQKAQTAKILAQQLEQMSLQYQQKLLTENLSQWEKKEYARQLEQKTNELQSLLNEIQQLNQKRNTLLSSFSSQSAELEQKQKMLDQLLQQVLNKDLRKLMDELKQLLEQKQARITPKDLQNINQNYQMLSQKLDKTIDFLKKVAIQQNLEQQSKSLEELSSRQDSLRHALGKKQSNTQSLSQKQQQLQKQLQKTENQYKQALEQNQSLKHPIPMQDLSQSFENIKKMMQQNQQLLSQGRKQKSRRLQKQIIDSLQNLSQKITQNMKQAQARAQMIDLMKIYKLISYLEFFSYRVEQTISQTQKLTPNNQSLPVLGKSIASLKNEFTPIADSLFSLTSQSIQLSRIMDDKIYKIKANLSSLQTYLDKRMKNMIVQQEKDILSNTNIILLILTEVATSLEKQMQNAMPNMQQPQQGQQQALMPLQQLQKQLQQQLEKLIQQAKKGQLNPKDLAQSLIFKEKINFEIQKLLDQFSNSLQVAEKLKEIQKINNQIERNLVDKQLDESLLKRAQLMKVKLWEAQNAIKKQNQYENKRIAEHQKQIFYDANLKQLNLKHIQQTDYLRLIQQNTLKVNKFYYDIFKSYRLNK